MKLLLSILLFLATTMTVFNALAHNEKLATYDSQNLCHPRIFFKKINSIYVPFVNSGSNLAHSLIYLTNTSDKDLKVTVVLRTIDGEVYIPNKYDLDGGFSEDNDPLLEAGATLRPHKSAKIQISSDDFKGHENGKITWEADECLKSAMTGAVRNLYVEGGKYDQGLVFLNGGNPF